MASRSGLLRRLFGQSLAGFAFLYCFSSRRRHTRYIDDWSSDVCSSDLHGARIERARLPNAQASASQPQSVGTAGGRAQYELRAEKNLDKSGVAPLELKPLVGHQEIGRASCRERE